MKKQLLLFALGTLPFVTSAQQLDQKMLPNSTGGLNSSIGNLSSPNLYDGSTNVNIPIHDYGNFGVSLSYNTKGVTVDELSGPVGTHWNLNAGGTITRVVRDIPDEASQPFDDPVNSSNIQYSLLGKAHQYSMSNPVNNRQYWDGENDEFMISAGPLQFTFQLGKDGYVFTYPQSNCKITPIAVPNGGPTHIYDAFVVSDEDGTNYYFNTHDGVIGGAIALGNFDVTNSINWIEKFYSINKWYLDSVSFCNGQKIKYEFEAVQYPDEGPGGINPLELYKTSTRTFKYGGPSQGTLSPWGQVRMVDLLGWTSILKAIHYPDKTDVEFIFDQPYQDPQTAVNGCIKSINKIVISNLENCVKYRFNKAYLTQNSNNCSVAIEIPYDASCNYNDYDKRMILKGIDVLSCDETKSQPYYSFEYSNTSPPFRWGNNRDFFGFCNWIVSCDTNTASYLNNYFNQVPNVTNPFNSYSGQTSFNRSNTSNVDILSALCLTKVKNAYGGSISFQYELHSGLTSVTDNLTGMPTSDNLFIGVNASDGLRLHRTIEEDKYRPNSKLITTYTYSGGQIFLNGGYFSYPSKKKVDGTIVEYKVNNNWVSPHQLVNGSNHGYSQVTVTATDNSGNQLSKTINYFSNFQTIDGTTTTLNYTLNGSAAKNYFQLPYTDKQYIEDWKLGLLLKSETFDKNNNILSRVINTYDLVSHSDYTSALTNLGEQVHQMRITRVTNSNIDYAANGDNLLDSVLTIATDRYVPYRGKSLLTSTTTQKFVDNNNFISDFVSYEYDDSAKVRKITTTNSQGEQFVTWNIYNYNLTGSTTLTNMSSAGIKKLISVEKWKKGSNLSAYQLFDANITCFKYDNGILCTQKVQQLRSLVPISYNDYTNSGLSRFGNILTAYNNPNQAIANFDIVSEVVQRDINQNPTETKLIGKNNYQSMIWDENNNQVATSNARLKDIGFTSFERVPEGNVGSNTEISDGRFSYKYIGVQGWPGAISGGNIYNLSPASYIKSPVLTHDQQYEMTLWTNGSAPIVSGAGITLSFNMAYYMVFQGQEWKCYKATFKPISDGILNFYSSSSIKVDEIRLFPLGATMTNSLFAPLLGVTSTTDPSGRITYFEYDKLCRLYLSRNQEGQILYKKDFHVAP